MSTIEDNVNTVKSRLIEVKETYPVLPIDPKRCSVIRPTGEQCRAPATRKTGKCAGHSGLGVAESTEAAREAQKASAVGRQAKAIEAKRSAKERYRAAVEDNAKLFIKTRLDIVKDATAAPADRLRCIESLENRALGKPTEVIEDSRQGTDTEALGLADLEAKRRELEHALPTVPEHVFPLQ